MSQLNISARIEFDIDIHRARWYPIWLASSRKTASDAPEMSRPQSISHSRFNSRTTNIDEPAEFNLDDISAAQPYKVPTPTFRHVPKKLSLVDRFDASPLTALKQSEPHVLSPIVQEDEPKSAKHALERRVHSWIAGSSGKPSQLLPKAITVPEPEPISQTLPTILPQSPSDPELNLDEFAWSVSSSGPSSSGLESSASSQYRLPSIHVENRMESSVRLTPSTCTSFGPPEYDARSPLSMAARTPFLDLGQRMMDDVPITPSTATSWGPPSRPTSPLNMHHAPSIHLGDRGEWSLPATPSTATSWGVPLSYPPTPASPYYIPTPDLGQRSFDSPRLVGARSTLGTPSPRARVWPYHLSNREQTNPSNLRQVASDPRSIPIDDSNPHSRAPTKFSHLNASKGTPWTHVWPYCASGSENRKIVQSVVEGQSPPLISSDLQTHTPWDKVWPYCQRGSEDDGKRRCWAHVWPYYASESGNISDRTTVKAPLIDDSASSNQLTQGKVWPYCLRSIPPLWLKDSTSYPHFNIYPARYPDNAVEPSHLIDMTLTIRYPAFNIYPAVYPNIVPYPPKKEYVLPSKSVSQYPDFNLYPPVVQCSLPCETALTLYPSFDIYPATNSVKPPLRDRGHRQASSGLLPSVRKPVAYPLFDLYPPVYPYFDLYPGLSSENVRPQTQTSRPRLTPTPVVYPHFDLYPDTSKDHEFSSANSQGVYPMFDLYPAVYPHFNLYSKISRLHEVLVEDVVNCSILPGYPNFDLYPDTSKNHKFSSANSLEMYPMFDLYPAVYPHFNLYPKIANGLREGSVEDVVNRSTLPGYPHFDLYPDTSKNHKFSSANSPEMYPMFDLYPAVYPRFNLYPKISSGLHEVPVEDVVNRPILPGYPSFELYPDVSRGADDRKIIVIEPKTGYPTFNLYPAVYPHFALYPAVTRELHGVVVDEFEPKGHPSFDIHQASPRSPDISFITVRIKATYPAFDLYPAVYPYFDLWPSILIHILPSANTLGREENLDLEIKQSIPQDRVVSTVAPRPRKSKSHRDLHFSVFPDGNVITPSGTFSESNSVESDRLQDVERNNNIARAKVSQTLDHHMSATDGRTPIRRSRSGSVYMKPASESPSSVRQLPIPTISYASHPTSILPQSLSTSSDNKPRRKLPPTPTGARRPSTSPRVSSIPDTESIAEIPEQQSTPSPQPTQRHVPAASPLKPAASLSRSNSSFVTSNIDTGNTSLSRTGSMSMQSPPKRNSVVLNRIKAYASIASPTGDIVDLPDALSKFPMPPPSNHPVHAVSKLNRSKYPFA